MSQPDSQPMPPGSVAVVLGTRPEIIKLAHIIRMLGPAALVVHTGQHYDARLSQTFLDLFGLPEPAAYLGVGGHTRGEQIGRGVSALDAYLDETKPAALVVQGDTNAVLSGGLAANAREIPLVHVEAGLRSHDRRMPEEHNRVLVDHLGDVLCAPTEIAVKNLLEEGISRDRIRLTGNTIIEAVEEIMPEEGDRAALLKEQGLEPNRFILSTFHRPENVDEPGRFRILLEELVGLELPVLLPLHPRSQRRAEEYGLGDLLASLQVIDPIGYREFLGLGAESAFLISDSGGVQEEVSVYKKPVLVVRRSTERPEVLGTFAELVELGPEISRTAAGWTSGLEELHNSLQNEASPYGDGTASRRIVDEIRGLVGTS